MDNETIPRAVRLFVATWIVGAIGGCAQIQTVIGPLPPIPGVTITKNNDSQPSSKAESSTYCESLVASYSLLTSLDTLKNDPATMPLGLKLASGGDLTDEEIRDISRKYLWLPVPLEEQLGSMMHAQMTSSNKILPRTSTRGERLYGTADEALAMAVAQYGKALPYSLQIFILDGDSINAEALPGGYVYVTRRAAAELQPEELAFVLGHEVGHIAKRHTGKQLQQRFVETGIAKELLQNVWKNRSVTSLNKLMVSLQVVERLQGNLASYGRDQESESDACSTRGMVRESRDPVAAMTGYLELKGSDKPAESKSMLPTFTTHPSAEDRAAFVGKVAKHYEQQKAVAGNQ